MSDPRIPRRVALHLGISALAAPARSVAAPIASFPQDGDLLVFEGGERIGAIIEPQRTDRGRTTSSRAGHGADQPFHQEPITLWSDTTGQVEGRNFDRRRKSVSHRRDRCGFRDLHPRRMHGIWMETEGGAFFVPMSPFRLRSSFRRIGRRGSGASSASVAAPSHRRPCIDGRCSIYRSNWRQHRAD